jgi:PAS domain S-box-containing protein
VKNNTTEDHVAAAAGADVTILDNSHDTAGPKQAPAGTPSERDLLRAVIDNYPDSIYAKDTAARKTLANKANVKNLGCKTEAEVLGKTDFDFFSQEVAAKLFADDQQVLQGESFLNREERLVTATGEVYWMLTTKVPWRDAAGNIVGIIGGGRNITKQKEAELKLIEERNLLRTLIDNLPDAIYAKDTAARKVMVNLADARNLGCQTEAEALGKSDFDLFPKEIAEKFYQDDQLVIQKGQKIINREEKAVRSNGEEFWLLTTKVPWCDAAGNIIGLVGIGRNITAIKQAEAKLEQAHQQLMDASRQAGMAEVATSVLHNVGNVLNSVNVASSCVADSLRKSKSANLSKVVALLREHEADLGDFITNDPKGKQLPGYLAHLSEHLAGEQTVILNELARLQKNVEHIMEIVAMQQSYAKTSGIFESLPIADLVEDAVRMNLGAMERHQINVLREYSETPPVLIEKHKVLQVLVNLIRNAKYACDDSVKTDKQIILRVANGNGRIKVSVIDNGIGIPQENLTRIFNHGFTTRKNGHGFGLHSGALAAKEMGGSLAAFSEGPERGATFILELPVQREKTNL